MSNGRQRAFSGAAVLPACAGVLLLQVLARFLADADPPLLPGALTTPLLFVSSLAVLVFVPGTAFASLLLGRRGPTRIVDLLLAGAACNLVCLIAISAGARLLGASAGFAGQSIGAGLLLLIAAALHPGARHRCRVIASTAELSSLVWLGGGLLVGGVVLAWWLLANGPRLEALDTYRELQRWSAAIGGRHFLLIHQPPLGYYVAYAAIQLAGETRIVNWVSIAYAGVGFLAVRRLAGARHGSRSHLENLALSTNLAAYLLLMITWGECYTQDSLFATLVLLMAVFLLHPQKGAGLFCLAAAASAFTRSPGAFLAGGLVLSAWLVNRRKARFYIRSGQRLLLVLLTLAASLFVLGALVPGFTVDGGRNPLEWLRAIYAETVPEHYGASVRPVLVRWREYLDALAAGALLTPALLPLARTLRPAVLLIPCLAYLPLILSIKHFGMRYLLPILLLLIGTGFAALRDLPSARDRTLVLLPITIGNVALVLLIVAGVIP